MTSDTFPSIPEESIFQRLVGRFFGYDFFISYHWDSGGTYALNLSESLRQRGYDVFFDRADFATGDSWKIIGERALRRTKRLVVVATQEAIAESDPVRVEIETFTENSQQVIPIIFNTKFSDLAWGRHAGLASVVDAQLYIDENRDRLPVGPSDETICELIRTQKVMRRRDLRALAVIVPVLVVGVFAAIATVAGAAARESASKARDAASRAQTAARIADKERRKAETEADVSFALQLAARSDALRAQKSDLPLSVMLASEAMKRLNEVGRVSFQTDLSLREGLLLLPKPLAQFEKGRLSSDGRFVVSFREEQWRLAFAETGVEYATIPVDAPDAQVLFTLNGERVAVIGRDSIAVAATADGRIEFQSELRLEDPKDDTWIAADNDPREIVVEPRILHRHKPISLSPDGTELVTHSSSKYIVLDEFSPGSIEVYKNQLTTWNLKTAKIINSRIVNGDILLGMHHDGGKLISVVRLNVTFGGFNTSLDSDTYDAETLASAAKSASLFASSGTKDGYLWRLKSSDKPVTILAFSRSSPQSGQVSIHGGAYEELLQSETITGIRTDDTREHAVITYDDGRVSVTSAESDEGKTSQLNVGEMAEAVSPDGSLVAVTGPFKTVRVIDWEKSEEVINNQFEGDCQRVYLRNDGRCRLVSADSNSNLQLWEIGGLRPIVEWIDDQSAVARRIDELDFRHVAKRVFCLRTMEWIEVPKLEDAGGELSDSPTTLCFSHDRDFIATNHHRDRVGIWDSKSGNHIATLRHDETPGESPFAISLSSDGKLLARMGEKVDIWSNWQSKRRARVSLPVENPFRARFSSDGRLLAVCGHDGSLWFYAIPDLVLQQSFQIDGVKDFLLSRDGRILAALVNRGDQFNQVEIWDTLNRKQLRSWSHGGLATKIHFIDMTDSGEYIVSSAADNTVRVWRVSDGIEAVRLSVEAPVKEVIFCDNESYIAVRRGEDPRRAPDPNQRYRFQEFVEGSAVERGEKEATKTSENRRQAIKWLWDPEKLLEGARHRLEQRTLSAEQWQSVGGDDRR